MRLDHNQPGARTRSADTWAVAACWKTTWMHIDRKTRQCHIQKVLLRTTDSANSDWDQWMMFFWKACSLKKKLFLSSICQMGQFLCFLLYKKHPWILWSVPLSESSPIHTPGSGHESLWRSNPLKGLIVVWSMSGGGRGKKGDFICVFKTDWLVMMSPGWGQPVSSAGGCIISVSDVSECAEKGPRQVPVPAARVSCPERKQENSWWQEVVRSPEGHTWGALWGVSFCWVNWDFWFFCAYSSPRLILLSKRICRPWPTHLGKPHRLT